jgi:hypothetical protein
MKFFCSSQSLSVGCDVVLLMRMFEMQYNGSGRNIAERLYENNGNVARKET